MFLQEHKQKSYTFQYKESNYQNYASVQTMLSIQLKFDVYIVDIRSLYYINFGVSRRSIFFKTNFSAKCNSVFIQLIANR